MVSKKIGMMLGGIPDSKWRTTGFVVKDLKNARTELRNLQQCYSTFADVEVPIVGNEDKATSKKKRKGTGKSKFKRIMGKLVKAIDEQGFACAQSLVEEDPSGVRAANESLLSDDRAVHIANVKHLLYWCPPKAKKRPRGRCELRHPSGTLPDPMSRHDAWLRRYVSCCSPTLLAAACSSARATSARASATSRASPSSSCSPSS